MADKDVINLELVDPLNAPLVSGHIYLPCSGSVNQVILHVDDSEVDETLKSKAPAQFMLVLAGGVISTYLKRSGDGRYAVQMTSNVLRDVIRLVRNADRSEDVVQPAPEEDVSVSGVIKGRALGRDAAWHDYVLGTVTFTCGPDGDRKKTDKVPNKRSDNTEHKFDHGIGGGPGGFDHSFLSATSAHQK